MTHWFTCTIRTEFDEIILGKHPEDQKSEIGSVLGKGQKLLIPRGKRGTLVVRKKRISRNN